jgi:hypothetical protein
MDSEKLREVYVRKAIETYRKKDGYDWQSALWCSRVVGNYEKGATLGLADDMSVSTDTIEDRAHAYMLFEKLGKLEGGVFRLFVFNCRRAPFIYMSHFRALYDLQNAYNLSDYQVLDLLNDIFQAEGGLSSRKLDTHTRSRYGDTRGWQYYAARAMKEINKTLQEPDLPQDGRKKLAEVYNWIGDNC